MNHTRRCAIESTTTTTPHDFVIQDGSETTNVTGRSKAIEQARELSRKTWRSVRLERDDGRVEMQFRRGSLEAYVYEMRRRH